MVSLKTVGKRFDIPFEVIEGGTGFLLGNLSETDQNAQPSYIFVQPRHVFRCPYPTAAKVGMVIRSPSGAPFIIGANGPSETTQGTLWQSFRLFEPTGRYSWVRRTVTIDPITQTEREGTPENLGLIWAAIESIDREQIDRSVHASFEQRRFITGASILSDDLLDNHAVTKVDKQLGLSIGVLT